MLRAEHTDWVDCRRVWSWGCRFCAELMVLAVIERRKLERVDHLDDVDSPTAKPRARLSKLKTRILYVHNMHSRRGLLRMGAGRKGSLNAARLIYILLFSFREAMHARSHPVLHLSQTWQERLLYYLWDASRLRTWTALEARLVFVRSIRKLGIKFS